MGSQQLLLIVVGVVVVGLAVVLGFQMFESAANSGYTDSAVAISQDIARNAGSSLTRGIMLGGSASLTDWTSAHTTDYTTKAYSFGQVSSITNTDSSLLVTCAFLPDFTKTAVVTIMPISGKIISVSPQQ